RKSGHDQQHAEMKLGWLRLQICNFQSVFKVRQAKDRRKDYISPGKLKPAVTLPISALEIVLACSRAWLAAERIMSSRSWASAGLIAGGSFLMLDSLPSHFATPFTAPPPLDASTVRLANSF